MPQEFNKTSEYEDCKRTLAVEKLSCRTGWIQRCAKCWTLYEESTEKRTKEDRRILSNSEKVFVGTVLENEQRAADRRDNPL